MIYQKFGDQLRSIALKRNVEMEDIASGLGITKGRLLTVLRQPKATRSIIERASEVIGITPWTFDEYVTIRSEDIIVNYPAVKELLRAIGSKPHTRKTADMLRAISR